MIENEIKIEGDPTSIEEEAGIWIVNEIGRRINELVNGGAALMATDYNLGRCNDEITRVIRDAVHRFPLVRANQFRARAVYNDKGNRLTILLSPLLEQIIYTVKNREQQKRDKVAQNGPEASINSST